MTEFARIMILLDHPCYGVDIYEAQSKEDIELLKMQGYYTLYEIIELAKIGAERTNHEEPIRRQT